MEMQRRVGFLFPLSIGLLAIAAGVVALGQPAPSLSPAPPIALQPGQTIEVPLKGQNLAAIASVKVPDAEGINASLIKSDKPEPNQIHLKIAASVDAALGERELRLIGPTGVTRPLRVFVSQYPVVPEREPNNQPGEAEDVSLPATVVGRVPDAGDIDQFRFRATKGRQLIFNVYAARIGSPLEPVITIHSPGGRELRTTVEHHGGDPVVMFQPPEDGQYLLRLRDLRYRGGGDYGYRIDAGQIPYLQTLLPSSGEPGKVVAARAIGYNLEGGEEVTVDLTMAPPGRIEVRARTPLGFSNPMPFEVTELPQEVEAEPNDNVHDANSISLPTEVSGHVDRSGDEDFYRFHLPYKQAVSLEVLAGRYGSPVTPLLQLHNVHGEIIESNDGIPDADARIIRELDAGDYVVSVRDLTFAGGRGYWYRLKAEPAAGVPQDFTVRFLPDAPRLHRGGNVAMWCEVKRLNGFHGDVTISPEGLPAGVSAGPITLGEDASGWFTLTATPDAALGTVPIRLRASATIGTTPVTHDAEPELDGRVVREAYLTVLDPAPFNVEAVVTLTPQRIEQMNDQIRSLGAKLNNPDPRFNAALAEWEKRISNRPVWTVLNPASAASAKSTSMLRQPDGSFLAGGHFPAQDEYTVTAHTDLKAITAVRLEVLKDDRLPADGPGAAPNGNFVLTEFKLLANKDGQPPQPVMLRNAWADFSQTGFPVAAAIDNNPNTGWAVDPQQGRSHTALFETGSPVGFDEETTLTFVLEHQSGFPQHILGRFRLSVTTADPAALKNETELPRNILAIVSTPVGLRTSEQKNELADYFRTIDPETAPDRRRLEALRSFAAPYAEMRRLETALNEQTPELDREQEQWEKTLAAGAGWSALDIDEMKSAGGARFERQPDGSVFVDGANPPTDTYTLAAATGIKRITAVRLEVLPDARLGGNGPGRAPDGNFVLTRFRVAAAPRTASNQPARPLKDVAIESARASFEQQGYGIGGALDEKDNTGWSVLPAAGRPAEAVFELNRPIEGERGSVLRFTLDQRAPFPQHTIGHFRIWVTGDKEPDAALRLPQNIAAIVKIPASGRSGEQQRQLAAYFRSVAPSLDPVRQRLADLRAQVPSVPLKVKVNGNGAIPVPIHRLGNFTGNVQITLEGFAKRREGDTPTPIGNVFKLNPLTIGGDELFGTFTFEPGGEETGTRMVVLKAEAKVGDETITEYSPAFPLSIEK